ncbi:MULTISPECIES: adenosylcobinamide amidohydrolase [Natrialbaceae]|uniref:adenosylcobinamide amidohydrolase n=1 Tax=Natrialbaceae TaxID=1644061 RepID=UPI00207C7665|nr:adenosylcobinamide amidohydrolase [Natronococcus sp. CG52]
MTDTPAEGGEYARYRDGVFQLRRSDAEWLSTGWNGGRWQADCAYNVSVPEGWERTDLERYASERLERAGFANSGPVLFTGVDVADARGARCGPVTVYATAGVSNPAALPMDPADGSLPDTDAPKTDESATEPPTGTVNLVVYTTRRLSEGALPNVLTVAAEAKAATLLAETGFPGTTTDAVIVGHDPAGPAAAFSGSGTAVGAATRACVRDAVRASLRAHYDGTDVALPDSVEDAKYGVSTDVRTAPVRPRSEPGPDGT